tara:strand:+ start:37 stop:363 length:327 start_codon:yes stop_codon:yes gene_type:complete
MSRLEIILSASLTLSFLINVGLFVYTRNIVAKLLMIADELYDLGQMVDNFTDHVETVYELETFYGDETLNGLMLHARSLNSQMDTFEYVYQYANSSDIEQNNNEEEVE